MIPWGAVPAVLIATIALGALVVVLAISVVRVRTARAAMAAARAADEASIRSRYEKIAEVVSGCLYQFRTYGDGRPAPIPYASGGLKEIFGIDPADVREDSAVLAALIPPEDVEKIGRTLAEAEATMSPWQCQYRARHTSGEEKWIQARAVPEPGPDGSTIWNGFIADITERKRAEARIYDLAYRDPLTRLPNRAALVESLQATLLDGASGRWRALLFIDLDQFKMLNDTKGHQFGDRLLCSVAARMTPIFTHGDMVARLGGDEFVVTIGDVGIDRAEAERRALGYADRIHDTLAAAFLLDGFAFRTSASIGIAMFRGGDVRVEDLLKRADLAMYDAKARGGASTMLFTPEMQAIVQERLAITLELHEALAAGQLHVVYQPQVDEHGSPTGVEALLRWSHPTRGELPPSFFIPLVERAGLGAQVDEFVLVRACDTLRRWRDVPAMAGLRMAVNIGSRKLDATLAATVKRVLRETEADASLVTIEITERVTLDDIDEVDATLTDLQKLGVKIALDDFGTGYSSLAHLKRLPIDTIKIDRSFIRDIEHDLNDRVIVQTILNIARNLGVAAIAEGVENDMQVLLLRRFGCRAYQGYLYGRPMGVEELEEHIVTASDPRLALAPPARLVV